MKRFFLLILLLQLFGNSLIAQRSGKAKKAKVVDNQVKIQIVEYSVSTNKSGTFTSGRYLKIGDSDEVPIKPDGSQVMKYFKKCPEARKLVQEAAALNKRGKTLMISGAIAGPTVLLGSLVTSVAVKNFIPFVIGAPIGLGATGTLIGVGASQRKKAYQKVCDAVEAYNNSCYQAPEMTEEEIEKALESKMNSNEKDSTKTNKEKKENVADLIRNEPGYSNLFGVGLIPFTFTYSPINTRFGVGVFGFYTLKSSFVLEADYKLFYGNNISGTYQNGIGRDLARDSYGDLIEGPTTVDLNQEGSVMAKMFFMKKEKTRNHSFNIGKSLKGETRGYKVVGNIDGKLLSGLGVRLGGYYSGSVVENSDGFNLGLKTGDYRVDKPDCAVYQQAFVAAVGVQMIRIEDLKFTFDFEGKNKLRDLRSQTDIYLDFLVAPVIHTLGVWVEVEDPNADPFDSETTRLIRASTENAKKIPVGARLGYQKNTMAKGIVGWRYGVELGIYPGLAGNSISIPYGLSINFGFFFGGRTDGRQMDRISK